LIKLLALIAFSVLLLFPVGAPNAFADIIYESATLGPTGQTSGGLNANTVQLLGSRFSISEIVDVTDVGGHFRNPQLFGNDLIFGAIVELSGPNAFPLGDPFTGGEVLAFTTFTPPDPSADISIPLSITLQPGDYALVFGAGEFGATGQGVMTDNNFDTPEGVGSYITWQTNNNWVPIVTHDDLRFTVNGLGIPPVGGELIPLDTSALLLAGAQMNAAWLIPVIVAAAGIGIVLSRKL